MQQLVENSYSEASLSWLPLNKHKSTNCHVKQEMYKQSRIWILSIVQVAYHFWWLIGYTYSYLKFSHTLKLVKVFYSSCNTVSTDSITFHVHSVSDVDDPLSSERLDSVGMTMEIWVLSDLDYGRRTVENWRAHKKVVFCCCCFSTSSSVFFTDQLHHFRIHLYNTWAKMLISLVEYLLWLGHYTLQLK